MNLGSLLVVKAYYTHLVRKYSGEIRFLQLAKAMGMKDADKARDFLFTLTALLEDCCITDVQKFAELTADAGVKKPLTLL